MDAIGEPQGRSAHTNDAGHEHTAIERAGQQSWCLTRACSAGSCPPHCSLLLATSARCLRARLSVPACGCPASLPVCPRGSSHALRFPPLLPHPPVSPCTWALLVCVVWSRRPRLALLGPSSSPAPRPQPMATGPQRTRTREADAVAGRTHHQRQAHVAQFTQGTTARARCNRSAAAAAAAPAIHAHCLASVHAHGGGPDPLLVWCALCVSPRGICACCCLYPSSCWSPQPPLA